MAAKQPNVLRLQQPVVSYILFRVRTDNLRTSETSEVSLGSGIAHCTAAIDFTKYISLEIYARITTVHSPIGGPNMEESPHNLSSF